MNAILIDEDFGLQIKPTYDDDGKILSGFVVGDASDQNAVLVLECSQGEIKEDPLLGAGLTNFIRSKYSQTKLERRVKAHFARAGIDYAEYKDRINVQVNTTGL